MSGNDPKRTLANWRFSANTCHSAVSCLPETCRFRRGPFIAYVHAYRGEADEALELLDQALEVQSTQLLAVQYKADFRNIHDDPRWTDFFRRIDELRQ